MDKKYLYHYSRVRYETLLSRELQQPPLTAAEREKAIASAKETLEPDPYFKHISFFTEPAPVDILGTIYGSGHPVWFPGSKLFEYKIDIDQFKNFTFRLVESLICRKFLDEPKYMRMPDDVWYKKRREEQLKAGEIGNTLPALRAVIDANKGQTLACYLNVQSRSDFEKSRTKYAANVPHLMVYFERGEIFVDSVRRVTVGNHPLPKN